MPHIVFPASSTTPPYFFASLAEIMAVSVSTPGLFKKFVRGRPFSEEMKQLIMNVYSKTREMNPKASISNVVDICVSLTGVARSTIFAVKADMKKHGGKPSLPRRKLFTERRRRPNRIAQYESFDLAAIRRIVHDFYRRNEPPTVKKVLSAINDNSELTPFKSESTLRRLLLDMGFKYVGRKRNSALIDREDIQTARRKFLRDIKEFRKQGRPIYYTDETWVNAGHTVEKEWRDETIKSAYQAKRSGLTTGLRAPSGKGSRLIITHAGNEKGFVKGAADIFTGKKTGDYHEEMDGTRYENWFVNSLIPNIETNSVIVMDNASYHSVKLENIPSTKTRKADIQAWLTSKGVEWRPDMIIRELLLLVGGVRWKFDFYRIDTIAKEHGHTVLRTPPYHCELNPIELVWGHIKERVKKSNYSFTLKRVEELTRIAIEQETSEMWMNSVEHVKKEEQRFWELDGIVDEVFEKFIITANTGDSSDSDSPDSMSGTEELE